LRITVLSIYSTKGSQMAETKLTSARYRELIGDRLLKAGYPVTTLSDAGEALRSIVDAFGYLLEIVAGQKERIENLEDQVWELRTQGMVTGSDLPATKSGHGVNHIRER
jgi:hypothetical protein